MTDLTVYPPGWDGLTPDGREWVRAELAKLRPLDEADPVHLERLANRLGLRESA